MKKIIRLTESDLNKIVKRIIEQVEVNENQLVDVGSQIMNVANDEIMRLTGTGKTPGSEALSGGTSSTNINSKPKTEIDVVNWSNKHKIFNGKWSRTQSSSDKITLTYFNKNTKEPKEKLVDITAPKNLKKIEGDWAVKNNKLEIKE
jgi:hypothetical protein